ncbi:MAG: galactose oxidase [Meiothermus sp.]|uniref:Kelch repeat-containing protein n=1 Tax=Meiothermus sp. TaxID=1955249 RepID=UPI0025F09E57|nr:kelch repeat-containing protein [Meiothermus sp.]MCS7068554.1 galactose oxidase [Meiothermus sp.]MCX7783060.1 galactose oxidase [Meiothermus sp.]
MKRLVWGLVLLPLALAQVGSWFVLAPLLEPRQEIAAVELGGKIYAVGGFARDRSTLNSAEVYDPASNQWSRLPAMPIGVNHPAAVALAGKLYVLGGYRQGLSQPTDAVQIYDPARGQWQLGTPMPSPRGALAAAVVEGRLYAIGGARGVLLDEVSGYDPTTNRWQILTPLPTPREHLAVGVVGNKIYVVGGRNERTFTLREVEAYTPSTNRWETLAPMPTGRSGHAVAVLGNCLYAFGGEVDFTAPRGVFSQVEVYSSSRNSWSALPPMPNPRHGHAAVTLNGRIYMIAGATLAGFGAVNLLEVFGPPPCE